MLTTSLDIPLPKNGLLSLIVQHLGSAILLEDADRNILFINQHFCDLFEIPVPPDDMVGVNCSNAAEQAKYLFVSPNEFVTGIEGILKSRKMIKGETLRMINGKVLTRDFTPVWLEDGRYFGHIWSYTDITDHTKTEELEMEKAINFFTHQIFEKADVEDLLWDVAKNCIGQLSFVDCVIYLLDEKRKVLVQKAAWGPKTTDDDRIIDPIEIPLGVGIVGHVAKTGMPELINDTSQDERYIIDDAIRHSELTVPLIVNGEVIGVIDSEHPDKNFFTLRHLTILSTVASLCAIKIQKLRHQQRIDQEILDQRSFYEEILNQLPADLAVFDTDHRYLFVNPMGIRDEIVRKWIIGKRDEDYCDLRNKPYSVVEGRRARFMEAVHERKLVSWEEKLLNRKGEEDYHIRSFYPVLDAQGNVKQVIGYGLNITDRVAAEKELQLAKNQAEEAGKAKDQFMARVSHEIRTPMTGIIGVADLLTRTGLDEKQQKYLNVLRHSALNLLAIVNDVLDIEKIVAGKMLLENDPFQLREKMEVLIATFTAEARSKGIELVMYYPPEAGNHFLGDPFRISQILANLLSNAVKFTTQGKVNVEVHEWDRTADTSRMEFVVRDTGIGIPADKLAEIFDPFIQVPNAEVQTSTGTGLGLAICQELAHLMGGEITVESQLGQGSEFRFQVPLRIDPAYKRDEISPSPHFNTSLFKGMKVLLAEDLELNRFIVNEMLSGTGIELTMVENGSEAIEMAQQIPFDIILMDIQMPVMNGVETVKLLRSMPLYSDPRKPILALTANGFDTDRKNYLDAGFSEVLSKPFEQQLLLQTMKELWEMTPERISARPSPSSLLSTERGKGINLTYLQKISGNNTVFIGNMLRSFVETAGASCQQIETLLEAKDKQGVAEELHKLIFALGVIGADTMKDEVRSLEQRAKKDRISIRDLQTACSRLSVTMHALIQEAQEQVQKLPFSSPSK